MIRLRLFFLAFVLLLGFGSIFFRAFQLQVFPTDQVEKLARRQLTKKVEIAGRRGLVLDRNGRELAVSVDTMSVFANPHLIKDPVRTARVLAPILGLAEVSLRNRLNEASSRKFVWVHRQLSTTQLRALSAIDLKTLPGIGVLPESRREYPHGTLAAHVLGFTSVDGNGMEGIEKTFDEELRGGKERLEVKRDAVGRPVFGAGDQIRLGLQHGENIELTIDASLQHAAEKALKEAVDVHQAVGGSVIVLEPYTGEVLALANLPTFDPSEASSSSASERRNRALTDPIEPASVVKPFVVARAIKDKIVTPDTRIEAGNGFVKIGRKTISEADAKHRFASLTVADILRYSSNVGTVYLSQKMGWSRIEDTYRRLGFDKPVSIELPGASYPVFRKPRPEQLLEQATMSFGQGFAITPLHIATAYASIANGGWSVRPRVVRNVGGRAWDLSTQPERIFPESVAAKMRVLLERVVEEEGTGVAAKVESFPVAGKTGTAQRVDYSNGGYERGAYWSSFAGFLPARQPRFVIYVMVDRPSKGGYYGGAVAAPVFAKVARAALQFLPAAMDPAFAKGLALAKAAAGESAVAPPSVSKAHKKEAVKTPPVLARVPDLSGSALTRALRLLEEKGLGVEIEGEGARVVEQVPSAGSVLGPGEKVTLKLR